ncbi:hypothetical protein C1645_831325 [Glomus cerebriforme]|uniref:HAT C-terminal dimerisation domain-containing protein n=1 Tax=Glomus cerebriforme TaxID=658196 RepID=A0A397SM91_9GLOM|nr:hypothetical protein C1645_831325 [Glomus cerebriforme]
MLYNIEKAVNTWKNQCNEGTSIPTNWWTSIKLKKGEDSIRKLALKMHEIMPHNASCERVYSVLGSFLVNSIPTEELNETLNQITLVIENKVDLFNPEVDFVFENINEEEVANLEEFLDFLDDLDLECFWTF